MPKKEPIEEVPEEVPEEITDPAPAIIPEAIETHPTDGPIEKLIKLVTDNQTKTDARFSALEEKITPKKEEKPDGPVYQEERPIENIQPEKPAPQPKPAKRGKLRLWRSL